MILATDEIARSLAGSWDLLNRRAHGLQCFSWDDKSFWRSFGAALLGLPAFIAWLASERAALGLIAPGVSLFDDGAILAQTALDFIALWLTLPMLAFVLATKLNIREKIIPFIIVCNWGSVIAATMLAVPATLFAIGWATHALSAFFAVCAAVIIMQMRWYMARVTLGVTASAALALTCADGLIGLGLLRLIV
jgi:hypothetical protein